jgi:hypothetical protein
VSSSAVQTFVLTVDQAPAIVSAASTTLSAGSSGTFTVTTTGYPTSGLTETGPLPAGVTFVDNGNGTATLAGTPAASTGGTYHLMITASNSVPPAAGQTFVLTVDQAPAFTSTASTTFTAGSPGTFTVSTTGVPAPGLTETGALPAGVTFRDNGNGTATLAGTAAAGSGGVYSFGITASNGTSPNAIQAFRLTVLEAPAFISPASATVSAKNSFSVTVKTRGYPAPSLTESGNLPKGVTFVNNGNGTGTLSGTTNATGVFTFMITAANGGASAKETFTLTVTSH